MTEQIGIPKTVELAETFGIIIPNFTLEDYLLRAVEIGGYETIIIWGVQGSGKSSRMLQMLHWIYKDWDVVLDSLVFKPSEFVERLESIGDNERMPAIGWDDIGVHYTSSTFKTDIKQYEAIDQTWAAIRTKVNVIIVTIPIIDRLAKNVRDNMTFEVFLGRNQKEMISRIYRLPGLKREYSNFFKVGLEKARTFNLYDVPPDTWLKYWTKRIKLTNEALAHLKSVTDMEEIEDYIRVLDVPKFYPKFKISPTTIQQNISRGVLRGKKIQGQLHVLQEDLELYVESKIPKELRLK